MYTMFGSRGVHKAGKHLDPKSFVTYARVTCTNSEGQETEATEVVPRALARIHLVEMEQAAAEQQQTFKYRLREVEDNAPENPYNNSI